MALKLLQNGSEKAAIFDKSNLITNKYNIWHEIWLYVIDRKIFCIETSV